MKRVVIGTLLFFVATLLATKFILNEDWFRSLFAALFQTAAMIFLTRYSNKKAAEQKRKV